jgi:hypothetical protein
MLPNFPGALAQAAPTQFSMSLAWVVFGLLGVGGLGWLIAAALGFARARAYGEPARWFAVSSVCLLLYHVQWVVLAIYGLNQKSPENVARAIAFFNLFIVLGAICAIVGFARMNAPRVEERER